jgi:hypothetical protein
VVVLLGLGVDPDEAVHRRVAQHVVGVIEVGLAVGVDPAMIEVGGGAPARVVERVDDAAVVVEVGVGAVEAAAGVELAAQAVDAAVVARRAAGAVVANAAAAVMGMAVRRVIWTARRVGQRAEVVIEGVVLLHDDDDVLDLVDRGGAVIAAIGIDARDRRRAVRDRILRCAGGDQPQGQGQSKSQRKRQT